MLLAACSSDEVIDVTYDPCSPLVVVTNTTSEPGEREAIESALASWQRVLPTRIELADQVDDRPALPIVFESGDNFYRAMYWDAWGEISISRDKLDATDYPIAIAHELGHAFGLHHVDAGIRASVMNKGNLTIEPTVEDAGEVRNVWTSCSEGGS